MPRIVCVALCGAFCSVMWLCGTFFNVLYGSSIIQQNVSVQCREDCLSERLKVKENILPIVSVLVQSRFITLKCYASKRIHPRFSIKYYGQIDFFGQISQLFRFCGTSSINFTTEFSMDEFRIKLSFMNNY
uniref:Uncharacterized protein n=1 Tax=Glossina brevipalpis TaxID=37001 RepID=A0A1A9WQU8_9MUSC